MTRTAAALAYGVLLRRRCSRSTGRIPDGKVMLAFAMNGEQLPLLNGFPLRLVVPGWYSTYWVKMLNRIEVLGRPDDSFWMKTAYTIPDTPGATMKPGEAGVRMVPINAMVPRAFATNPRDGGVVQAGAETVVRGLAFGGDAGVQAVDVSLDGDATWAATALGRDEGTYSFRQWQAHMTPAAGAVSVMVRCTNARGLAQPTAPNWDPNCRRLPSSALVLANSGVSCSD